MAAAPRGPTSAFEISKLQNEIRMRDRQLDAAHKDATALKSSIAAKERVLAQLNTDNARLKEKALKAEGDAAAANKELSMMKAEKRKTDSTMGDLKRQCEKLKEKVSQLSSKGPGFSEEVARLESEMRMVKKSNAQLSDETKAVTNQLRAKDRELTAAQAKQEWAAQVEGRNKELENEVLALKKTVEQTVGDMRTLQNEYRRKDQDVCILSAALEERRAELERTQEELGLALAQVKASDTRCSDLATELSVTRDELARTAAVAARVAASEQKAGLKVEGTITMAQHVEEVKYLQGETTRLKDKLALMERDMVVAHSIKEKYRTALEAANLPALLDLEKSVARTAGKGSPAKAAFARRFSGAADFAAALDAAAEAGDEDGAQSHRAAAAEVAALPEDPTAAMEALSLGRDDPPPAQQAGKGAAARRRGAAAKAALAKAAAGLVAQAPVAEAAKQPAPSGVPEAAEHLVVLGDELDVVIEDEEEECEPPAPPMRATRHGVRTRREGEHDEEPTEGGAGDLGDADAEADARAVRQHGRGACAAAASKAAGAQRRSRRLNKDQQEEAQVA